jgi:hypothetical protein
LRGLERDRGFLTASGTGGARLHFLVEVAAAGTAMSHIRRTLRLAILATLGFVFKLFIVEKELFTGGKNEVITAIHALQASVLEFHFRSPPPRDGLSFILGRRTDGTAIRKLGGRPFNRDPPRKN